MLRRNGAAVVTKPQKDGQRSCEQRKLLAPSDLPIVREGTGRYIGAHSEEPCGSVEDTDGYRDCL